MRKRNQVARGSMQLHFFHIVAQEFMHRPDGCMATRHLHVLSSICLPLAINRCALLDDGSLKCFGRNHDGQLGIGDTEDRGDEVLGVIEAIKTLTSVKLLFYRRASAQSHRTLGVTRI